MVAINFPAGAVATDRFTDAGKTWEYDGSGWNLVLSALQIPLNSIDSSHLVSGAVHTTKIVDNAITRLKIVDDAIDVNKLDAGTPTHNYYLRSNTGVASGMEWASVQSLSSLDDLGDVSVGGVASGQFLKWNGSAWVPDVVDLATDTNGNYVSSVTAGKAIEVTHTPSEGSSPTVAVMVEDDQLILASRIF
jgi:hypothetical protein